MKIAQIVCAFPPYHGGIGNSVYNISIALSQLQHEVTVFTPLYSQDKAKLKEENSINIVYEKPFLSFGKAAMMFNFLKTLKNFDIVHLHYPFFGTAEFVALWKKFNNSPLVITYHMDALANDWRNIFFSVYTKILMPKILKSADALIATSFDYLEHSYAQDSLRKYKEKWHEIPLGVDNDFFQAKKINLKVNKLKKQILFVGGMDAGHYFKGIPVLLSALQILKNEIDFECVLVGDGNLKNDFILLAQKLGLGDRVKFVGAMNKNDLRELYSESDILVVPSENKGEAFGLVILEAFASGVPVVTSDLYGVRELGKLGGDVFKVGDSQDLANKIKKVLIEFGTAEKQLELLEVAKKYSWGNIALKLDNLYKNLR